MFFVGVVQLPQVRALGRLDHLELEHAATLLGRAVRCRLPAAFDLGLLGEGIVDWAAVVARLAAPKAHPAHLLFACNLCASDSHAIPARYGPSVQLFLHGGARRDGEALRRRIEGSDDVGGLLGNCGAIVGGVDRDEGQRRIRIGLRRWRREGDCVLLLCGHGRRFVVVVCEPQVGFDTAQALVDGGEGVQEGGEVVGRITVGIGHGCCCCSRTALHNPPVSIRRVHACSMLCRSDRHLRAQGCSRLLGGEGERSRRKLTARTEAKSDEAPEASSAVPLRWTLARGVR
ncbi:hypothetical protein B0H63DRAFT_101976, partial [Podospora didyma]